jgi:hypothetical protein
MRQKLEESMLNGGSFEEFVLNLVKIDTKLILGGKSGIYSYIVLVYVPLFVF